MHVVIIDRWIGFPNGMATTQRIKLIGQALVEQGARVTVLIAGPSERPNNIVNQDAAGEYKGVQFEYLPNTTVRSDSFLQRRLHDFLAHILTFRRIIRLRRQGEDACIYLWYRFYKPHFFDRMVLAIAKVLGVPVVLEVNERPWPLIDNKPLLSRITSPLFGASGAIAISDYLADWINAEAKRRGQDISVATIPILVDMDEFKANAEDETEKQVVFAGSAAYASTIEFILDAMAHVWEEHPDCNLVITGFQGARSGDCWLEKELAARAVQDKVHLTGYLPRLDLLELYGKSSALLIPLFSDVVSISRFPTKIGEYLTSGRPIITNKVGSVPSYFTDGVNAYIAEPGDPSAFGHKVLEALNDKEQSKRIGLSGRETAEKNFTLEHHKESLFKYFTQISRPSTMKASLPDAKPNPNMSRRWEIHNCNKRK